MGRNGVRGVVEESNPLFETKEAKGRVAYKLFASTIFVAITSICTFRIIHIITQPKPQAQTWIWIGMFMAELCFGFYWFLTQSLRWNIVHRLPFKQALSHRYGEKLPNVDIFVCTADPTMEPPILVINTILSVMAYNYPAQNLSVYLSDDGCSDLTFYALLEASHFAKHWIPFCKHFMVEPRSPSAYFAQHCDFQDGAYPQQWVHIKKLYEEMKNRIELAVEMNSIPKEFRDQHKGFSEWNDQVTKRDHQSIVQIIIDRRDKNLVDIDGCQLPALVYMSREKKSHIHHNFKAGSINAMMRVSSEISNAPIILLLDCDMYSNNSESIKEALCFLMDEERGHEIPYVQYPQFYNNITRNDLYSNSYRPIMEVEMAGLDGFDGALFSGTGCFHKRESLSGKWYSKDLKIQWTFEANKNLGRTIAELEESSKVLANCSYEIGTSWGKEMGMMYGCPVEDIITGLTFIKRGWKPIYYNPNISSFVGVAPPTLDIALVQYKRWAEGMFQIFLSKWCPFIYCHGKLKFGAQLGYCVYLLWAPISLPVLYYVIVPPLCMLQGISLFPKVSSLWFIPFVYVFMANKIYSITEALQCGHTLKAWWNLQRMWVIRRTTSYFFAFVDTIIRQLGLTHTTFAVTTKVVTDDVMKRYEQEVMEFGSSSVMFTIVATLALLNLFGFIGGLIKILLLDTKEELIAQIALCLLMVMVNLPVYEALFIRRDKGSMPSSLMFKSIVLASFACFLAAYS